MKKISKIIFPVLVLILINLNSYAVVLRLNNRTDLFQGPAGDDVYTSWGSVYAVAANGDTIIVEGSNINYGAVSLYKQLHIIGPGYNLTTQTTNPQYYAEEAAFSSIVIGNGAAGSIIEGVSFNSFITVDAIVDGLTLKKIKYQYTSNSSYKFEIKGDNITLEQSLIKFTSIYNAGYSGAINIAASASNVIIRNNIILRPYGGTVSYAIRGASGTSNLSIYNNTIVGNIRYVYNAAFFNNTFYYGYFYSENSGTYQNNITGYVTPPYSPSTYYSAYNVDMSNVYVNGSWATTDEDDWDFTSGSTPAHDAGVGGVGDHLGHMGGTNPYVKAGMPNRTAIYSANVPVSGSGGSIDIDFSSKSH